MTETLKVGLIGCGTLTESVHLPTVVSLPELFEVTACFDREQHRAEQLAKRAGAASTQLDALLASVDVVAISGAEYRRAREVVAACRSGIRAVLVDLPVGLTASEVEFCADVARGSGTPVLVHTPHAYDPSWLWALDTAGPLLDDLVLARVTTAAAPDEALTASLVEPIAPPAFDPDAAYTTISSAVAMAGVGAPAEVKEIIGHLRRTLIHDLATVRAVLAAPIRIDHVAVFDGGLEVWLRDSRDRSAQLTTYRHGLRRTDWRVELLGKTGRVAVELPPTTLAGAAATATTTDAQGRRESSALAESGHRAGWRRLHAAASGCSALGTTLDDALADMRLAEDICRWRPDRDQAASRQRAEMPVAVFGAGVFAAVHLCTAAGRGKVRRVVSRTRASAEPRAALVGAEPAAENDPGVLDDVAAVVVAGPPRTHAAQALAALERGLPVLVEKPMTLTVGEARLVAAEVARRRGRLAYGENWAFRADIQLAAELARSRGITEIEVTASWLVPTWGDYLSPSHGGGVLYDSGAHAVELARLLLGRPVAVDVSAALAAAPTGVDRAARVEIRFRGAMRALVDVAWNRGPLHVKAAANGFLLELAPKARLVVDGMQVPLPEAGGLAGFLAADGILGEHAALTGHGPVLAGVRDGLAVMEIIAAAYSSAGSGRPVSLPFEGDLTSSPYELWRAGQTCS